MKVQGESWCFPLLLLTKQNQVVASSQPFVSVLVLGANETHSCSQRACIPSPYLPVGLQCLVLLRWDKLKVPGFEI